MIKIIHLLRHNRLCPHDFWDTFNDWDEGQRIEVLAYAELPYCLRECELVDNVEVV